jgi:heparanase 1
MAPGDDGSLAGWAAAAAWTLSFSPPGVVADNGTELILVVDFVGDAARLLTSPSASAGYDALLNDCFYNAPASPAQQWETPLTRLLGPVAPPALTLRVLPLREDAQTLVGLDVWPPPTSEGGQVNVSLALNGVRLVRRATVALVAVAEAAAPAESAETAAPAAPAAVPVSVIVDESAPLLELPPASFGFALDWWPPQEEEFGTSTVNLIDLTHPRLRGLARALSPATLRLGGSLDNVVTYLVGGVSQAYCERRIVFRGQAFEGLCLNMTRFSEFLDFVGDVLAPGSGLVFGLQLDLGADGAQWNSTNALAFLAAAASLPRAGLLRGIEVGEETNPQPATDPAGFAALLDAYRGVGAALAQLFPDAATRPLLLGPCSGMGENVEPFSNFTAPFLAAALPLGLGAFVMHSYNNDGGGGWARPGFLNETGSQAVALRSLLDGGGAAALPLWCGECGPHNGGGLPNVTDRAISSFWFTDALLGLPLLGVTHFTRQTLAGGRYSLLANDDFAPRPDFFAALAFVRLAGPRVLNATSSGPGGEDVSSSLRVFATCAAAGLGLPAGAVTLAYINVDAATSFSLSAGGAGMGARREDFVFAPLGGDVLSPTLTLNGAPLVVAGNEAPALVGVAADGAAPVTAAPLTFGYVLYPDANAQACA